MLMKIILVTALIGALASPALAATKRHANTRHHAQVCTHPQQPSHHSSNPGYDVYVNGKYVGSDPDGGIRYQLQREMEADLND